MPDPLDLARCRALCGEAEARAELRLTTASQVREVTTALRAACDEVERLRGGACRHCGCIKPLEAP